MVSESEVSLKHATWDDEVHADASERKNVVRACDYAGGGPKRKGTPNSLHLVGAGIRNPKWPQGKESKAYGTGGEA